MTPPHIETIARAMLKAKGLLDYQIEIQRTLGADDWLAACADATLAFFMSAEICAEAVELMDSPQAANSNHWFEGWEQGQADFVAAIRALAVEG